MFEGRRAVTYVRGIRRKYRRGIADATYQPRYEIHVPPPSSKTEGSEQTWVSVAEAPTCEMSGIVPYTRVGASRPMLHCLGNKNGLNNECLRQVKEIPQQIEACVRDRLPLIYLHVVKAKDATLLCVPWRHIVMDAGGMGTIVKVWERYLSERHQSTVGLLAIGPESDIWDPTALDYGELVD